MLFDFRTHRAELQAALAELSVRQRTAFACWCSERMCRWYDALSIFLGLPDGVKHRKIIDCVWGHVRTARLSVNVFGSLQKECEELSLGDEGSSIFRKPSIDAIGCTWLALETCKNGAVEPAAKAGAAVVDSVHGEVMAVVGELYDRALTPDDLMRVEQQMTVHPTIRSELARQAMVIRTLKGILDWDDEVIHQIIELAR